MAQERTKLRRGVERRWMLCHGCSSPVFWVPAPRSAVRPRHQQPLRAARIRLRVLDVRIGLLQSVGLVQDPHSARFEGFSVEFRRRQSAVLRHAAPTAASTASRDEAALPQLPAVDGRLRLRDGRPSGRQRWFHGRNPAGTASHRLQPVDGRSSRFDTSSGRRCVPVRQRSWRSSAGQRRRQRRRVQQHRVASSPGEAACSVGVRPCRRRQRQRRLHGLASRPSGGAQRSDRWTAVGVLVSVHTGRDIVWRSSGIVAPVRQSVNLTCTQLHTSFLAADADSQTFFAPLSANFQGYLCDTSIKIKRFLQLDYYGTSCVRCTIPYNVFRHHFGG